MSTLCVQANGGGVQSTALLILIGVGKVEADAALFANVGDDSEAPEALEFVHEIAMPWASEHGIEFHELWRTKRDGSRETVYGRMTRPGVRMSSR